MTPQNTFDTLPTELLLEVFKYLEIKELCRLKQTCKRFNDLIQSWEHYFINNSEILVTNQIHPKMIERCGRILSLFERLRVSRNWRIGAYQEISLLFSKTRYLPSIHLDEDVFWISRGGMISGYQRNDSGFNPSSPLYVIKGHNLKNNDCHFIKKNNYLFSGQRDGSLWLWSLDKKKFIFRTNNCHNCDINSVDMNPDILVSGCENGLLKIWHNKTPLIESKTIRLEDRIWSVALEEETRTLLAVGTAGLYQTDTLNIFDLNTNKRIFTLHRSEEIDGVLQASWESPNCVWFGGYNCAIIKLDLRSGSCVQSFKDPYMSAIYCFQRDYHNSVVGGTQNDGRVLLWDTRQDQDYVQMYYMESCRKRVRSSPIYGVAFDAEFLFAGTDMNVTVLKFSGETLVRNDYCNLFSKTVRIG